MFGSVLNSYLDIIFNIPVNYIQFGIPDLNHFGVDQIPQHLDMVGRHILGGNSRITQNHCWITLFHTFSRNPEVVFRFVRHIPGRIFRWLIFTVCIDTKQREVTCMSWPCPVILFSAKITNTCWRSKYQTYIIKYLIDKQKILITIIERLYSSFIMSILLCLSNNSIDISPDLLCTF